MLKFMSNESGKINVGRIIRLEQTHRVTTLNQPKKKKNNCTACVWVSAVSFHSFVVSFIVLSVKFELLIIIDAKDAHTHAHDKRVTVIHARTCTNACVLYQSDNALINFTNEEQETSKMQQQRQQRKSLWCITQMHKHTHTYATIVCARSPVHQTVKRDNSSRKPETK